MSVSALTRQLQLLFKITSICAIAIAEAVIWLLYTQPSSPETVALLLSIFLAAGLLSAGILITRCVLGLVARPTRRISLSYLVKTVAFIAAVGLFLSVISLQLIRLNQFRQTDEQVLIEENAVAGQQVGQADSAKFVPGVPSASVSAIPKPVAKPISNDPFANDPFLKNAKWGETVQVAPHTYRTKVAEDSRMSTVPELFQALNNYRQTKGLNPLNMDDTLTGLANERVLEIPTETEAHKGFNDRMNQTDPTPFEKYGFIRFGENFSRGYTLSGTHLIEWVYAGDAGHDSNQLGDWNYVGIAIKGTTTVLEFGWK